MKKIIVANQKGGVGKTTTVVNLAASLALLGKKVLALDLDPQSNLTSSLGFDKRKVSPNIYHLLMNEVQPEEAIKPTSIPNLKLIPASPHLAGARIELVGFKDRETRLKEKLATLSGYDYIFIDPPPALGVLTLNGLVAAETVIIPVSVSYYALEGLSELLNAIRLVKRKLNPSLSLEGVLMTMYDLRVKLSSEIYLEVKNHFKEKVYQAVIPNNVKLAEAPSFGKPAILYDKSGKGTISYFRLAKEMLGISDQL
jgi:chromosome partitioning protein